MVSLLFFKSRFRNKGVMKKSGKRKKRNEIQCIIKVNHWRLFKLCFKNVLFMNLKKICDHNVGKFRTYFFIKNNYA